MVAFDGCFSWHWNGNYGSAEMSGMDTSSQHQRNLNILYQDKAKNIQKVFFVKMVEISTVGDKLRSLSWTPDKL